MNLNDFEILKACPDVAAETWVIGLSGGLDSVVLLHYCVQYRNRFAPTLQLRCVHVNHGLAPEADQWQALCESLAGTLGVECLSVALTLDRSYHSKGGGGLEKRARDGRYEAFRQQVPAGALLMLAHHQQDQVETVLYRLFRGSGVLGLGGMQVYSEREGLRIWRPFLNVPKSDLQSYAHENGLNWAEDPSNADSRFDRNFIRNDVVPVITRRWPQLGRQVTRSARLNAESAALLNELAEIDWQQVVVATSHPDLLDIVSLQQLSDQRLRNLLRFWLLRQGASLPSEAVLGQITRCVRQHRHDQQVSICWGDKTQRWQVAQYSGQLAVGRALEDSGAAVVLEYDRPHELASGFGVVRVLAVPCRQPLGWNLTFTAPKGAVFEVRFRQGGETFRPQGRPSKSLKKWFNSWRIPYWLRDAWPLLYCNGELLIVLGCGHRDFSVAGDDAAYQNYEISWQGMPGWIEI